LLSVGVQRLANGFLFPFGTFSVNLLGCFLIGLLAGLAEYRGLFTPELRALLLVGFLGGFTTFSTFGFESVQLIRDGEFMLAGLNVVGQVILGLVGVWLGFVLARAV
jgi:CrcB protein